MEMAELALVELLAEPEPVVLVVELPLVCVLPLVVLLPLTAAPVPTNWVAKTHPRTALRELPLLQYWYPENPLGQARRKLAEVLNGSQTLMS